MFGFMLNGFIWVFFRKNKFDLFYYLTGAFNSHNFSLASESIRHLWFSETVGFDLKPCSCIQMILAFFKNFENQQLFYRSNSRPNRFLSDFII